MVLQLEPPAPVKARPGPQGPRRRLLLAFRDRPWLGLLAAMIVGALAGVFSLRLVEAAGDVGPARVRLSATWEGDGGTVLAVPPLGRVLVDSHDAPLRLRAQVAEIDVTRVQDLITTPDPYSELGRRAGLDLAPLIRTLVIRSLLFATLAGAVAGAILPYRRWRHVGLGAGGGLVTVGLLLGATWRQYDTGSFASPRFEGTLERAPDVLEAVRREMGDLAGVRDRVSYLSGQLEQLLALATDPEAGTVANDTRILHISDVHLNPLGLELARALVERFDIDAVVDTGDLMSFGLPFETSIGELIEEIPAPYYFVAGNHDSPANRRAITSYDNVRVLDGDVVEVEGVSILGIADPGYTADGGESHERAVELRREQASEVATEVRRHHPDVLAVASLTQAEAAVGSVPLVISGDVHERSEREDGGTRLLTVGSTGATGLGAFTADTGRGYEAQILHFRTGRLVALDYVTLEGVAGSFSVSRVDYSGR